MKKNKIYILGILAIALVFSAFKFRDDPDDFEFVKNMEIFYKVMNNLRIYYVDDIDSRQLITDAINKTLEELDPYTVYFPESQVESVRLSTEASFVGIGIYVAVSDGKFYVSDVMKNSTADKAGLKVGDEIIKVSNMKVKGLTYDEFHNLMVGENGSELHLVVNRNGKSIEIKALRKKQDVNVVTLSKKIDDIGYIKLEMFSSNSASEFKKALQELEKENIKGLIVDLRDNPGGLLDQAVKIVNLFIPRGKVVVTAKGKDDVMNDVFMTMNKPVDLSIPIVVLINGNSASASEIFSGTMQDYDRSVLIGQRSFGKGLVQRIYDAGYNSKVKITVAKYYIPSGRCIQAIDYKNHKNNIDTLTKFYTANGRIVFQGAGILPDILVEDDKSDLIQMLEDSLFIFKFCNYYFNSHKVSSFDSVQDIKFDDFDAFLNFIDTIGFYDKLESIKQLDFLPATNEKIINQINLLKKEYKNEAKNEIIQDKDKIVMMIEKEFANRLFYHEGMVMFSIENDIEVKKALEILRDTQKYNEILNKK